MEIFNSEEYAIPKMSTKTVITEDLYNDIMYCKDRLMYLRNAAAIATQATIDIQQAVVNFNSDVANENRHRNQEFTEIRSLIERLQHRINELEEKLAEW